MDFSRSERAVGRKCAQINRRLIDVVLNTKLVNTKITRSGS